MLNDYARPQPWRPLRCERDADDERQRQQDEDVMVDGPRMRHVCQNRVAPGELAPHARYGQLCSADGVAKGHAVDGSIVLLLD